MTTEAKLKKLVGNAAVTRADRDDDIKVWHVDLSEELNETIDIEAKSEKEARAKVLEHLIEREARSEEVTS